MLASMIPYLQKECFENQGDLGAEKNCFQKQARNERYIDI